MIVPQVKHRFDREAVVLAPNTGCRSELIFNTVFLYYHKQARTQDGAEDLGPKVHEDNSPPLVWITQITALGDRHNLAFVPFGEIRLFVPVGVEEIQQGEQVRIVQRLERVRGDIVQAGGFSGR